MFAALNPEVAARQARAFSQVSISTSGKVSIRDEFRSELLGEGFTEDQIYRGLIKCAPYVKESPKTWPARVRQGCQWAREDDQKQAQRTRSAPRSDFRF